MTPWQRERLRVAMAATVARPASWLRLAGDLVELDPDVARERFSDEAARTLVGVVEVVLEEAEREHVVICGVPRAGKTTFVRNLILQEGGSAIGTLHTDDLIRPEGGMAFAGKPLDWSGVSDFVAEKWLGDMGGTDAYVEICEGVAAVRALRKWLERNDTGKPCDRVLWFGEPVVPLTGGQLAMAKGCWTVWREVEPILRARGVEIEVRS